MGQAVDALRRAAGTVERRRPFELADAVVHLAGIPAPGLAPDVTTFQNNLMTTYNVFSAATMLGLKRVVWASSETLFGLPFTRAMPAFAPITEEHPMLPENGYALAKAAVDLVVDVLDTGAGQPGRDAAQLVLFMDGDHRRFCAGGVHRVQASGQQARRQPTPAPWNHLAGAGGTGQADRLSLTKFQAAFQRPG